ncbi:MAG: M48 family metallopeptidase [Patescibacteria group bacterium]|jgi:hypothetical protein
MPVVSKKIKHQGQELVFDIKRRARIRYLRLAIDASGTLVLTAPKAYPFFLIKLFVTNKWIWILQKIEQKKNSPSLLAIGHTKAEIDQYKKITKNLVLRRIEYFSKYYRPQGDHPVGGKKISVRNQKSRWGSCSSKGNLNFNYRLCLLPSELADYIIVHELCHLQEMNHSQHFWLLVAQTQPNYRLLKKQLKSI